MSGTGEDATTRPPNTDRPDEVAASPAAELAAVATTSAPRRRRALWVALAVFVVLVVVGVGLLESAIAIAIGVGGAVVYFVAVNKLLDLLPEAAQNRLRPWAFVFPVLAFLLLFLVIPGARTVYLSLLDPSSGDFVWLENYGELFTDDAMRIVFRNNVFWIVGVTTVSTLVGLLMAVLADRVKHESLAKSLVFLPMAISFVGASVIWRLVYDSSRLGDESQVGLLNAIWVGLGGDPVFWLLEAPWNTFLLIVAMIWLQTGFAMVVLSAAIKGVPTELLEAARIDGANEWKAFRHVTLPSIAGTVAVVVTTTIILVLKVFDIVRVMTGGRADTSVIANEMIDSIGFGLQERAGALAVLLFVAVVPILIYNVRRFRREEALR